MKNQDWKLKYQDLKLKFHDAVDTAFRLGMEQGLQQAQIQQAQQAAMQPAQDPNAESGQDMNSSGQSDGSELDQHIGQLESMLQKPSVGSQEQASMQKSLNAIKEFQHTLKQASELRKSEKAIAAIDKSLNKKSIFTMSKSATKNLNESGKKALSMQEQIVEDLMKSMAEEEVKVKESINKTLSLEQLLKE